MRTRRLSPARSTGTNGIAINALIRTLLKVVLLIVRTSVLLPVSETAQLIMLLVEAVSAQMDKAVITGCAIILLLQADGVADTPMAVDTATEHQVLMIEIVNAIMVSVVMNSAKAMGTRIVPICRQAAEPPAVPRSSRIATVLKTTSAAS